MFEYDPARSRIDHVMFVFVSQVRKKRAIDARVSVNLKNVIVATCQQWQYHPKDPLKKKVRVNKTEKSIIIGMAGRRGGGGGDRVKAQFPCVFARDLETPWYIGECRATSCLSCSSTLSKQFLRFHSNYTANVVFQGQDMHAFFICHHEQARNVRKSFRRYRSS